MTVQEAEKKVRNEDALEYCKKQSMLEQMVGNETWRHYHYAAKALEEVEQYRALGTVEELKEAREKQIPKKPIIEDDFCLQSGINRCPNCGKFMNDRQQYCEICGQRIDVKSVNIPRGINK